MVIWLIGLSGAGKTTVGRELAAMWRSRSPNVVLVDGDEMRRVFGLDRGPQDYSLAGRRANAERITAVCEWLDRQGMNVVCCILSLFPDMRAGNHERFSRYGEIYLRSAIDTLRARDTKGLYRAAEAGTAAGPVAGIDIPFSEPTAADVVIDTDAPDASPVSAATRIMKWIEAAA